MKAELNKILKQTWGYDSFRQGQLEIIESIIIHKKVLAILTTGGGKSLCYQVPGLFLPGLTIVISPLISLMDDQVQALRKRNISAKVYSSQISLLEKEEIYSDLESGKLKFLYLAPESLENQGLFFLLKNIRVSLVAIDEAHCISVWGHDFRPAYLQLHANIRQIKSQPAVAAFTATATPLVKRDIIKQLRLHNGKVFQNSFKRTNLNLAVNTGKSMSEMNKFVINSSKKGPVIIYSSQRKKTEEIAERFLKFKLRSGFYHGGMRSEERQLAQERFLNDEISIIAATNAFGMGVDKSNVRQVVHFEIPDSLENYYQEAGRAGRDGVLSNSDIFFSWKSVNYRQKMIDNQDLTNFEYNQIYNFLISKGNQGEIFQIAFLKKFPYLNWAKLKFCLELMQKNNLIIFEILQKKSGEIFIRYSEFDSGIIFLQSKLNLKKHRRLIKLSRNRLKSMVGYCVTKKCRMNYILEYFGEYENLPCNKCDNCLS